MLPTQAFRRKCMKKGKGKWIIIVIVVIVIIAGFAGGNQEEKKEENKVVQTESVAQDIPVIEQKEEEVVEEKSQFGIGEAAEYKDVKITLMSYEESQGDQYFKPSEGNIFVMAEFEVENNSDSEIVVSSAISFDAYADGYSLSYSVNALMANKNTQLDGTVAPGKKLKGVIGYEVPVDWKEIEIHFTENVWSSKKIEFIIVKE